MKKIESMSEAYSVPQDSFVQEARIEDAKNIEGMNGASPLIENEILKDPQIEIKKVYGESPSKKSVNKLLKQTRLAKGYKLQKVVEALNISEEYIKAIESGHLGKLPSKSYTVGFIRAYAQYLGLDPREVVENFRETYQLEPERRFAANFQSEAPLSLVTDTVSSLFSSFQNSRAVIGIVLCAALGFLGLRIFSSRKTPNLAPVESYNKAETKRIPNSSKEETPLSSTLQKERGGVPVKSIEGQATSSSSKSDMVDISTSEKSLLKLLKTSSPPPQ